MIPGNRRDTISDKRNAYFWGSVIAGGAGLLGDILGYGAGQDAAEAAAKLREQALAEYTDLPGYEYQGDYNPMLFQIPEEIQYQLASDSPELRQQALESLNQIQQISQTGMSPAMQAAYIQAQKQAGEFGQGREQAIIQDLQRRGMSGSGLELAGRQMASQSATDMLAQIQAQKAADEANMKARMLEASLTGASNLRSQDVNLSKSNADIINQFNQVNALNQQRAKQANIEAQNQAALTNRNAKQDISNLNTRQKEAIAENRANAILSGQKEEYAKGAAKAGMFDSVLGTLGKTGAALLNESSPTNLPAYQPISYNSGMDLNKDKYGALPSWADVMRG